MKILLLLLFMFKVYAACEPGAVPCEEAGISNFKVQTVDPTFTASPGEKGLFNTNSQFKTKDQFGNIQRLVQDQNNLLSLGNGDVEEGLTGFLGIGTLNTTTPIQGLKSINLDTTALNDFAETALVTIPPFLMGQTCMIKANIRGGDANLQLQVVNGAGTIVGFKQLAVFTDSTPQFITFQCPTQALITATPALGQLKIKVVQSTATNSALATLDSFYLGQFVSNTMVVSGVTEEYLAQTVVGTPAGGEKLQWNTVTSNTINNTGTITNDVTNKWTFTAKVPAAIVITCSASPSTGQNIPLSIKINGIAINYKHESAVAGSVPVSQIIGTSVVKVGDIVTCVREVGGGVGTNGTGFINFTATPLPQLATIVSTNQMRAGRYATKYQLCTTFNPVTGNATAQGVELTSSGCSSAGIQGFAVNDGLQTTYSGITLSKVPSSGFLYFSFPGGQITLTGDAYLNLYNVTESTLVGARINSNIAPHLMIYPVSAIKTNVEYRIRCFSPLGTGTCKIGKNGDYFQTDVLYEPDLSDPYSIPELFAALPPQVINSSGKQWRVETCVVSVSAGVASFAHANCNTWAQSVTRTALGNTTVTTFPNMFSGTPICVATVGTGVNVTIGVYAPSATSINTEARIASTGAGFDVAYFINCQGPTP